MRKQTGSITMIEVFIIVAIAGIIALVALQAGRDRTKCVGGYLFTYGYGLRNLTQILDDQGHGIRCSE